MESLYEPVSPQYYEKLTQSSNPLTRHYHTERYQKIRKFLSSKNPQKLQILDLGCGTSSWNIQKVPITGLDFNQRMLDFGKSIGTIKKTVKWDLTKSPLPFEDETFDVIILSEVLEHLEEPDKVLRETTRILKAGGWIIVTVPLDMPLSLWWFLFGAKCFMLGDVLGDPYYKKRCGHIQHFSAQNLSKLLEKNGFTILSQNITVMNVGVLVQKKESV